MKSPPPVKTSLVLPPDLWTRGKALAALEGRTLSEVLTSAMEEYLARAEKKHGIRLHPAPRKEREQ
jgi:predicted DNA-binding protein